MRWEGPALALDSVTAMRRNRLYFPEKHTAAVRAAGFDLRAL
jgi:hypothetical protein